MDTLNNDMVVIGSIIALAFTILAGLAFGWKAIKTISK
jgi:hypothetical protein